MNEIDPQKINIGTISPVESGAKQKKSSQAGEAAFDKILANQIEGTTAGTPLKATSTLPEIESTFTAQRLGRPFNPVQFAQKVASSLDMLETYASWLKDPDKTLKQAYDLLEQVSDRTEALEQEFKADTESNTDLKDILTRLRTTLAVEQIKFNRGDYSA